MDRLKKTLLSSVEAIGSVLIVVIFFVLLWALIYQAFPSGTSLRSMLAREPATAEGADVGPRAVAFSHNVAGTDVTATLAKVHNKVKNKRAEKLSWETSRKGMSLYDRDSIQTLRASSAEIQFADGNTARIGEKTLLIIKHMEEDLLYRNNRSFMVLIEGELRGRAGESTSGPGSVYVETPSSHVAILDRLQPESLSEYKITVNQDKSSTISVYQGSVEVSAQGKKVIVSQDQWTKVNPDQAPSLLRALPDPVRLDLPAHGSIYYTRELSPRIRFAWHGQEGGDGYHFVMARDASFSDPVVDRQITGTVFVHDGLREGDYFWQVSAIEEGSEGRFSEARGFRVVKDREPPFLEVLLPPETTEIPDYTLSGKTDPGASLFVGGLRIEVSNTGEFQHDLSFRPGKNIVTVAAVDAANNVTSRSRVVYFTSNTGKE